MFNFELYFIIKCKCKLRGPKQNVALSLLTTVLFMHIFNCDSPQILEIECSTVHRRVVTDIGGERLVDFINYREITTGQKKLYA